MKKRTRIPEFKSIDEEFEFWSTHSALEFMDEGEEVEIDFSEARKAREKRRDQHGHKSGERATGVNTPTDQEVSNL